MIDGKTKIVGLFGYPVRHSASPQMHNAAFKALGLNFVYIPFEIHPDSLRVAVKALPVLGIRGVNLTIPHKVMVLPYLNGLSKGAGIIKAVNTVVVRGNNLYGYNSDIDGFRADFKKNAGVSLKGEEIFLLGAGGAGRAVAVALAEEKVAKINIADSVLPRAHSLLNILKASYSNVKLECISRQGLSGAVGRSAVIINATPLGMKKDDPVPIPQDRINRNKIIYDLVYTPCPTKLLEAGRKRGAKVISGIGMLAHQGAKSFNLWTGKDAPVDVMMKALKKTVSGKW